MCFSRVCKTSVTMMSHEHDSGSLETPSWFTDVCILQVLVWWGWSYLTHFTRTYWYISHADICEQKDIQTYELSYTHNTHSNDGIQKNTYPSLLDTWQFCSLWSRSCDQSPLPCFPNTFWYVEVSLEEKLRFFLKVMDVKCRLFNVRIWFGMFSKKKRFTEIFVPLG
jgi:hypothetical protein